MENLDNKDYRIFPINAAKVLSNKEAYIYLALLFKSDFQTGESNVLLETLSKETGYDTDTVSSYLHKAKDKGFVDIAIIQADRLYKENEPFYVCFFL